MKNIVVIGTGYVGLVSGAGMSDFGNNVCCVDVDKDKIDFLANRSKNPKKRGISSFFTWLDQYI